MSNKAAWITEKFAKPFVVKDAPCPTPGDDEVLIKVAYAAVNPVDWKVQKTGFYLTSYPNILGEDVAGEVVETGKNVNDIQQGDRVIAHLLGLGTGKPEHGGFQYYALADGRAVSLVPDTMSLEEAAVLPLAISTASMGLYLDTHLGLPLPTLTPESKEQVVLVWGGSSSVGITAIQLAKASGLKVATTCSSHNTDLVKSVGADYIFDYNSTDPVSEVVAKLEGTDIVGAYDAIGEASTCRMCAEILSRISSPSNKKTIASVLPPPENLPEGIKAVGLAAFMLFDKHPELAKAIWTDFVPQALSKGILKPLPSPVSPGEGLENVQAGLDMSENGVSGKKIVVKLQ